MSLIDDVLFYANEIADDNRFVYSRWNWPNGNGAGSVAVPYHMDCCVYISYCIYLAKGWTWYDQPYGYYWPHPEDSGFDYFLVNTVGCDKYTWPNVPNGLQPGDIIITTPALGHTFMIYDQNTIADNSPGFALDYQVSLKPISTWSTNNYWYIYRMPGGSSAADLIIQADVQDSTFADGTTFTWDKTDTPWSCTVVGNTTAIRYNNIWMSAIADTPFVIGKTYRLKFIGDKVRVRGYFYRDDTWNDLISEFNVNSDYDFTIPENTGAIIIRLWVDTGQNVNETVTISIYSVEQLVPPLPGAADNIKTMPVWMMLNPFM